MPKTRTEADIEAELIALDAERATIHERMLALNDELSVARAREQLAAMGDGERAALLQVVQTDGIASTEAVQ